MKKARNMLSPGKVRWAMVLMPFLLALNVFVQRNIWRPYLRFADIRLGYIFVVVILSIPLAYLMYTLRFPTPWPRLAVFLANAPLLLLSAWPLFWAAVLTPGILINGVDPSYERIHEKRMGRYQIAVFRCDHGGMSSFNIAIRQEREVLPGLLRVKDLGGTYGSHDARIIPVDDSRIEVEFAWHKWGSTEVTWGRKAVYALDGGL